MAEAGLGFGVLDTDYLPAGCLAGLLFDLAQLEEPLTGLLVLPALLPWGLAHHLVSLRDIEKR